MIVQSNLVFLEDHLMYLELVYMVMVLVDDDLLLVHLEQDHLVHEYLVDYFG